MISQKDLILQFDWNNLLILDATRFDYFQQEYPKHLNGNLIKVWSEGSSTHEWLVNTFPDYYDQFIYVSANPMINSLGVPPRAQEFRDWKATDHFAYIKDVWDICWDEQLGTVPPRIINYYVQNMTVDVRRSNRKLIHYLQPHAPYIGNFKIGVSSQKWVLNKNMNTTAIRQALMNGRFTLDDIRRAYRDNLRLVLETITELIPNLKGKTIITTDHGELLLDKGRDLWHYAGSEHPLLREVPWFEVEK